MIPILGIGINGCLPIGPPNSRSPYLRTDMRHLLKSSITLFVLLLCVVTIRAQDVQFAQHVDVSSDGWVFYNLTDNRVASEQEASFGAWDVAFQGTSVKFNGPSQLLDSPFDQVEAAPKDGYAQDEDGTSQLPSDAESRWFHYDFTSHIITALPSRTAVFQSRDGSWGKLNITDYYKVVFGQGPVPRMLSFRWTFAEGDALAF